MHSRTLVTVDIPEVKTDIRTDCEIRDINKEELHYGFTKHK